MLRGAPVPVIDLARLLGEERVEEPMRYILLQTNERRFALAVASIDGLFEFAPDQRRDLPSLFKSEEAQALDALATRDREVLAVLDGARLVPCNVWRHIETEGEYHADE